MTTGVLVDVGESGVYVTPIFEGFPVAKTVRSVPCGGGDLTRYLDYMLISRTNEQFNQMVGEYLEGDGLRSNASQFLCLRCHSFRISCWRRFRCMSGVSPRVIAGVFVEMQSVI